MEMLFPIFLIADVTNFWMISLNDY